MKQIVKFPNSILRTQAPVWDFENPPVNPEQLEKELQWPYDETAV